ncbi:protein STRICTOSIDINE SYNTHASE-LIKE 3-like [Hordeum vulgare]|nr:protein STRICTOSIDINE SYNTHASE-LIKE 3-like [Hordeum vulgare]
MVDFPGFEAHLVDLPDTAEMPQHADAGERLRGAEIRFRGEVQGPESVAFDVRDRGPYMGFVDGWLLVWDSTLGLLRARLATTSPNHILSFYFLYPLGSPGFSTDRVPPNTTTSRGATDPSSYSDDDGEAEVDPNVHPEDDGTTVILDEEEDDGEDLFNDDYLK